MSVLSSNWHAYIETHKLKLVTIIKEKILLIENDFMPYIGLILVQYSLNGSLLSQLKYNIWKWLKGEGEYFDKLTFCNEILIYIKSFKKGHKLSQGIPPLKIYSKNNHYVSKDLYMFISVIFMMNKI